MRTTSIVLLLLLPLVSRAESLEFNRDIRPILAEHCFRCHGRDEDKRRAGLRLDVRESALAELDSGQRAIVPGDVEASELVARITEKDPLFRMPPKSSKKQLTATQIERLTKWIQQGAKYQTHWSFVPPKRPMLPKVQDTAWPRNEIDRFVLARLEAEGLRPSPTADPYTLVRRLYLDLIGLPPTPREADLWVERLANDGHAYGQLVDRLLASKHYGERWARPWLDIARYSDTNGYEKDRPRSMWPYRDWVIRALNADMPFDRFTIEQLAGDMLPGATQQQRIATGFHRNTMLNEEGGIDPLEFRYYAMVDRVATTGIVWMGLTTGCAQCHTHKYDPITHTDYYSLMALLDNADEPDLFVADPNILKKQHEIEAKIASLEAELGKGDDTLKSKFTEWIERERRRAVAWKTMRAKEVQSNLPKLEVLDDGSILSSGDITKRDVFGLTFDLEEFEVPITAIRIEVLPDDRLPARGPGRAFYEGRKGDFFLSEVTAEREGQPIRFRSASHTFGKLSIGSGNATADNVLDGDGSTGWSTAGREGDRHVLVLNLAKPIPTRGTLRIEMLFERHFAASLGRFRIAATSTIEKSEARTIPNAVERLLTTDPTRWNAEQRDLLRSYFLSVTPTLAQARKRIEALRRSMPSLPTAMVMQERPKDNLRKTFRHHRGEYLSPREEVKPAVPALFRQGAAAKPTNRLAFARWLVSDGNPLVGRVTVNRAWRAFFGAGLVRTSGDFGTQAEAPTHPSLLDWLAVEFVERGWSMKQLHRTIAMSATYRQRSHISPELLERDPDNRLLARGPRYRVDAEMVRDILLTASGRLSEKMYGPSVYPPQPASVTALAYGNSRWPISTGEDRYRRSLYTFSKRTAPFAAFTVFDGPTGETCLPKRNRSNTPLQALTLLNDAMYLEFTQALAKEVCSTTKTRQARATAIFRRLLTRPPTSKELDALLAYQLSQRRRLRAGELDASKIADDADATPPLAAWVMVARAVMNLDETIAKQ